MCAVCAHVERVSEREGKKSVNLDDPVEYDIVVIASAREFNEVSASSRCVFVVHLQFQQKYIERSKFHHYLLKEGTKKKKTQI